MLGEISVVGAYLEAVKDVYTASRNHTNPGQLNSYVTYYRTNGLDHHARSTTIFDVGIFGVLRVFLDPFAKPSTTSSASGFVERFTLVKTHICQLMILFSYSYTSAAFQDQANS